MKKISANIKFLRKNKGLTQEQFATEIGIKRSMVGAYEEDRASPKLYSEMIAEDRRLKLSGYEVYRFGGYELSDESAAEKIVESFLVNLFKRHDLVANAT
jgi:transcriptional regulator with XRE-family HTH domain